MGALERALELIEKFFGDNAEIVLLFGSRARGSGSPSSDYDILVILNSKKDKPIFWKKLFRLEVTLGVSYDVVLVSKDEITADNPLIWGILTGYKVLKGQEKWEKILNSLRKEIKAKKPVLIEEGRKWEIAQLI
ncbi:nucleotidyltransferase domain-containing protein [Palaeococcus ferrophilus]|uniref:nucleotidyltransferase domain-containing protein n=1 Tax=Palaeococcus ferrophilus TaxID=83868 RepID=UPI00064E46C9|nr:nucleotidyltransferase domain-containing protein [Palaeococcus ferrophilus]